MYTKHMLVTKDVAYARLGSALRMIDSLHSYAEAVFLNPVGVDRQAIIGDTPTVEGLTELVHPMVMALTNAEMQLATLELTEDQALDPDFWASWFESHFDDIYDASAEYVSEVLAEALGSDFSVITEWMDAQEKSMEQSPADKRSRTMRPDPTMN